MRFEDVTDYLSFRREAENPLEMVRFRKNKDSAAELRIRYRNRPHLFLRGGRSDYHMFHRIFRRDEYRLAPLLAGRFGTVIDLGGNVGMFAARIAPYADRVISCEPVPENFARLTKNLGGHPHVTCLPLAVGDRRGALRIYLPRRADKSGTFTSHREGQETDISEQYVEAPMLSLADLLAEQGVAEVDLLKIDTEGAEYDILYAAAAALPRIRRIHGEYHDVRRDDPRTRADRFIAWLAGNGYHVDVLPHPKTPNHGMFFASRR